MYIIKKKLLPIRRGEKYKELCKTDSENGAISNNLESITAVKNFLSNCNIKLYMSVANTILINYIGGGSNGRSDDNLTFYTDTKLMVEIRSYMCCNNITSQIRIYDDEFETNLQYSRGKGLFGLMPINDKRYIRDLKSVYVINPNIYADYLMCCTEDEISSAIISNEPLLIFPDNLQLLEI